MESNGIRCIINPCWLNGNIRNRNCVCFGFRGVRVIEAFTGVKDRKENPPSVRVEDQKAIGVSQVFLGHLEQLATPDGLVLLVSLGYQAYL